MFSVKHPLTYAETLIDYHLCSHPKYKFTHESHRGSSIPLTQKQFLHHTVMSAPGCLGRAGLGLWGGTGDRGQGEWAQWELRERRLGFQ